MSGTVDSCETLSSCGSFDNETWRISTTDGGQRLALPAGFSLSSDTGSTCKTSLGLVSTPELCLTGTTSVKGAALACAKQPVKTYWYLAVTDKSSSGVLTGKVRVRAADLCGSNADYAAKTVDVTLRPSTASASTTAPAVDLDGE